MFNRIRILIFFLLMWQTGIAQIELEGKKGSNGKFGFSDQDDHWVIAPTYDEITEFYESPFTFVKSKGKWGVIDHQNNIILPFVYSKVIIDEGFLGDEQNTIVVKNGKYGVVSRSTGKAVVECIYDKPFEFTDGIIPYLGNLSVVYRNNKAGLLNEKGVEIVACNYDGGKIPFPELDYDYYCLAKQGGKTGVIDTTGQLVVPCVYDEINPSEDLNVVDIVRKKKHGIFSLAEHKELVAPLYDNAFFFEGNYAIVQQHKKFGAIDKSGNIIVPIQYDNDDEVFLELDKRGEKN